VTDRSRHATVGGRYRGTALGLGRWRRPAFAAILGFALLTTLAPIAILLVFSFARKWGYYHIEHAWTTDNWTRVFTDRTFLSSLGNSLQLGVGTAIIGMAGFSILAYTIVRTRFVWRGTIDVLTWFPSVLPGIILSLGLLDLYLGSPIFRPLYNSILGMVIATFIGCMTIGVQVIKTNLMQLGVELEESARISGASWWQAHRAVILPLTMPSVLLCGTISFTSRSGMSVASCSSGRPEPGRFPCFNSIT
jgi:iron(III) transport system permease protein